MATEPASIHDLKAVRESASDCAGEAHGCDLCSPAPVIKLLQKATGASRLNTSADIAEVGAKFGCRTERCLLQNDDVRDAASEIDHRAEEIFESTLQEYFKVEGVPHPQWLSNLEIDPVLKLWSREFRDFVPIPYAMSDFDRYNSALANFHLAAFLGNQKQRCIACVLNTATINQRGEHWVCLFAEKTRDRQLRLEYFNSVGRPPFSSLRRWIDAACDVARGLGWKPEHEYNTAKHQKQNSECGMYCLLFIRARLEGMSFARFNSARVPDEQVAKFRAIFHAPSSRA